MLITPAVLGRRVAGMGCGASSPAPAPAAAGGLTPAPAAAAPAAVAAAAAPAASSSGGGDDGVDRSGIERNANGTEEPHTDDPELWNIDGTEMDVLAKYKVILRACLPIFESSRCR